MKDIIGQPIQEGSFVSYTTNQWSKPLRIGLILDTNPVSRNGLLKLPAVSLNPTGKTIGKYKVTKVWVSPDHLITLPELHLPRSMVNALNDARVVQNEKSYMERQIQDEIRHF